MHFATYITNFMFHLDTWDLANVTQCSARGLISAHSIPIPHCWNRLNIWGGNQRIPLTGVALNLVGSSASEELLGLNIPDGISVEEVRAILSNVGTVLSHEHGFGEVGAPRQACWRVRLQCNF